MWYSGSGVISTSLPSSRLSAISAWHCSMLAIRLRWVSMAPLATPVVPPVYCSTATSPGCGWASRSGRPRPRSSTSVNFTACGRW
ncbi:hypothetical protein D3C75_866700 [compost metagenome]